jgi:hypothetical protein
MKSSKLALHSVAMVVKVLDMGVNVAMETVRLIGRTLMVVDMEVTAILQLLTPLEES